jgi:DNA primase
LSTDTPRIFIRGTFGKKPTGRDVGLSYLQERGLTEAVIRQFQLGFAPPGKNVFTRAALEAGYKEDLLTATRAYLTLSCTGTINGSVS